MTITENALANRNLLVTGATGFIGAHLAQRLADDENAAVTATGRKLDAVPFLQEKVSLRKADLLNRAEMGDVLAGQEVVFHIAAWMSERTDDEELARRINVDATRDLIAQAAQAGVRRVIMTSSIAAYGVPNKLLMDEGTPVDVQQSDTYGRTKALGEMAAREAAAAHGIELVIVRPGMVYGPRSYSWTTGMFDMVVKGLPTLFGKAEGHAFPVYIDNLCDLLILAATQDAAVGETFNAVDDPVTWNQFFSYFGEMAGKKPRRIPYFLARGVVLLKQILKLDNIPLTTERLRFYQKKTVYPYKKATQLLGYTPRVRIAEGMANSADYLRSIGRIPHNAAPR
jgi:nucleoside-diphosphate-sugar epimerase